MHASSGASPPRRCRSWQQDPRGYPITAISRDMKALRGTKRVCPACAARFYDLIRDPIVCPSCGVHYVPDASPAPEAGTRAARFTDKTGWRGRGFRPADTEPDAAADAPAAEDATEETLIPGPNEDAVLEDEPDEADISGLLDHHESEPKER
jgi:uncharacterized protein (TIGR02300 family)